MGGAVIAQRVACNLPASRLGQGKRVILRIAPAVSDDEGRGRHFRSSQLRQQPGIDAVDEGRIAGGAGQRHIINGDGQQPPLGCDGRLHQQQAQAQQPGSPHALKSGPDGPSAYRASPHLCCHAPVLDPFAQSCCSARSGSMASARRAGIQVARAAATASTRLTVAKVSGSKLPTP